MFQRLAITINAVIFVFTLILELSGFGLIARARAGCQYDWVVNSGIEWVIVSVCTVTFLALTAINVVALLLKDRRFLITS